MSNEIVNANENGLMSQCRQLAKSNLVPGRYRDRPDDLYVVAQRGRELGLGPMESITSMHVIDGTPSLSAQLMLALCRRRVPGLSVHYPEAAGEKCVIIMRRPEDDEPSTFVFTMDDAARMGLTKKQNWVRMPRHMLRARVISEACRAICPDAMAGIYTPEELNPDLTVDEDGEVIEPATVLEEFDEPRTLPTGHKVKMAFTLREPVLDPKPETVSNETYSGLSGAGKRMAQLFGAEEGNNMVADLIGMHGANTAHHMLFERLPSWLKSQTIIDERDRTDLIRAWFADALTPTQED